MIKLLFEIRRSNTLTSKERVYAALKRESLDRIPIFMWFHPETARLLSEYLDIPVGHLDDVMFNDIRQVWVGNNYAMEGFFLKEGETYLDYWGIEWVKEGFFNQIAKYPLIDADEDIIQDYKFPYNKIPALVDNLSSLECKSSDYFIGCDISPSLFEMYNRLRGMENSLMDIALYPEMFASIMEKCADFNLALANKAVNRLSLDWLWTGDDVSGQNGMMMSPKSWRERIKPQLARLFNFGKSHDLWVAYHSCGSIPDIIPDLIEIGLDVLNPIQSNCPGMDPARLKRDFGKDLTFMGGIDPQDLLPKATVLEVQREVGKLLETLAPGGGYILAASHTIPPETPLDNIFAMYSSADVSREMILDKAGDVRKALTN
jgi:uroporphyrinogen decarboxylase